MPVVSHMYESLPLAAGTASISIQCSLPFHHLVSSS